MTGMVTEMQKNIIYSLKIFCINKKYRLFIKPKKIYQKITGGSGKYILFLSQNSLHIALSRLKGSLTQKTEPLEVNTPTSTSTNTHITSIPVMMGSVGSWLLPMANPFTCALALILLTQLRTSLLHLPPLSNIIKFALYTGSFPLASKHSSISSILKSCTLAWHHPPATALLLSSRSPFFLQNCF